MTRFLWPRETEGLTFNGVSNTSRYMSNVYIGVAGRRAFREEEPEYALLHIAHQIAWNRACVVDYGYVSLEEPESDTQAYDSNFDYDDSSIGEILGALEIIEEHRFPGFTVVAARNTRAAGEANYPIDRRGNERPSWLRKVPDIPGWYAGVGIGEGYSEPYKNIRVADITAAQTIALEKNLFIRGFTYDYTPGGKAGREKLTDGNILLSKAELKGFYILDRWAEPDGSCYYSLGIARK
ncbi:MAG: hypothetical protein LBC31_01000 [Treponema sp.]|nr:hypothetical protein [Treponema sp.]